MSTSLEDFYERELIFLEETAPAFANRFPAQAGRLLPEAGASADPHLERFIEACTLLAGRVQHKVDSDFPQLTENLMNVMYPHLAMIIPSLAIVQTETAGPIPRQGVTLPRLSRLFGRPVGADAVACQYQLGAPVTLWPIRLTQAQWQIGPFHDIDPPPRTVGVLRLELVCNPGASFDDLPIEQLRIHLAGERQTVVNLYESLFLRSIQVSFRSLEPGNSGRVDLAPKDILTQVGLDLDEGLLPFPKESFPGYRLLMELLSFPQKFAFADVGGWKQIRAAKLGGRIEMLVYCQQNYENLERGLSEKNLLLGCAPIINLFSKSAEPIDHHHRVGEYRVMPARKAPLGMEVVAIERVANFDGAQRRHRELRPFYAYDFGGATEGVGFWFTSRKPSPVELDSGTDFFLSVVDPEYDPMRYSDAVLDVDALCSNRDLPSKFQQAGDELRIDGPKSAMTVTLRLLASPTKTLRPPLGRSTHWRLLGQNLLNHLSLVDAKEGKLALQELLRLCDFTGVETAQLGAINRQIIDGIVGISARPTQARIQVEQQLAVCRGLEVQVELDEQKYAGIGAFLVASVLERFFGLYCGLNAFTKLVTRTSQAEGIYCQWPARAIQNQLQ